DLVGALAEGVVEELGDDFTGQGDAAQTALCIVGELAVWAILSQVASRVAADRLAVALGQAVAAATVLVADALATVRGSAGLVGTVADGVVAEGLGQGGTTLFRQAVEGVVPVVEGAPAAGLQLGD